MQATLALREKAAQLLAADANSLAPAANANKMRLVKAAFTPSEALLVGDLTFADFDGSTAIDVELGAQDEALDANTNDANISIVAPVGGFRWETTGTTNLPQTIYGFALLNNAMTGVWASALLDSPIELTAVNQEIDLGACKIRQLANSMV